MASFVLTAQLQLSAPTNVGNVRRIIQNQLNNINANINIKVNPQQIAQLQKLQKNVTQTGKAAKVAGNDMEAFGKQSALAIRRFGAFVAATYAFRKFVSAIGDGFKEAIEFERELIKISQVTDKSVRSLKPLTAEVTRLSKTLGVSSAELLKSSRVLAQTGLTANKVKTALQALAKADLSPTFGNMASVTEGLIAVFRQFNIEVEKSEAVLGSINAVSSKFAVESSDIIAAVRRTGGAFKAAGGELNELIALFTSVRATTRESAESIATGFRTIFTRLQRTRTINFLGNLGVDLRNLQGEFIGPFEAIKKLSAALKGLSTTDPRFAQIVEELGGFRQISKVIPLIQQFDTAQRALNVAQAGSSSLSKDAAKAQNSLAIQMKKVREEFTELIRKISDGNAFKTFAGTALKVASSLIKVADAITPLLTLFSALAVPLAATGFAKFLGSASKGKGFLGNLGPSKFATGGVVPGVGSGDTVPAMLTPGEFVLRKSAVKSLGLSNAQTLNAAKGGNVPRKNFTDAGAVVRLPGKRDVIRKLGLTPQQYKDLGPEQQLKEKQLIAADNKSISDEQRKNKKVVKNIDLQSGIIGGLFLQKDLKGTGKTAMEFSRKISPEVSANLGKFAGATELTGQMYRGVLDSESGKDVQESVSDALQTGIENTTTKVLDRLKIEPFKFDAKKAAASASSRIDVSSIEGFVFEAFTSAISGARLAEKGATFDFPDTSAKTTKKRLGNIFGPDPINADIIDAKRTLSGGSIASIADKTLTLISTNAKLPGGGNIGDSKNITKNFAKGGNVDSVPAMLTPGEFVDLESTAGKVVGGFSDMGIQLVTFITLLKSVSGLKFLQGAPGSIGNIQAKRGGLKGDLRQLSTQRIQDETQLKIAQNSTGRTPAVKDRRILSIKEKLRVNEEKRQVAKGQFGDSIQQERRGQKTLIAGAVVGAVGNAVGSFISNNANEAIARGEDATFQAGVGGTLSGAATGAAVGAMFGPFGIAIGAAAGGVYGWISSLSDATAALSRVKFADSLKNLTESFDAVNVGGAAPSVQAGNIGRGLNDLQNRFSDALDPQAFEDVKGAVRNTRPQFEQFTQNVAATSSSLAEFTGIVGEDTIETFTTLNNISVADFNKGIEDGIDLRIKLNKVNQNAIIQQNKFVARIRAIVDIGNALKDAAFAATRVATNLDDLGSSVAGLSKVQDFSGVISRGAKGETVNTGLFDSAINSVAAKLGGRGNTLAGEAKASQRVIQQLPDILLRLKAQDPLGQSGNFESNLATEIKTLIGGGPNNQFIVDAIVSRAKTLIGSEGKDEKIVDAIQKDVLKVAKGLGVGLEDIIGVFSEAAKISNGVLNQVVQLSNKRLALEFQIIDGVNKSLDIASQRDEVTRSFNKSDFNVGRARSIDTARQKNILGKQNAGLVDNPAAIGNALDAAESRKLFLTKQINKAQANDLQASTKLIKARTDEQENVVRLSKSLKFLADVSARTAADQRKLAELQKGAAQVTGVSTNAAFGSAAENRKLIQTMRVTKALGQGGLGAKGLQQLPDDIKKDVLNLASSLGSKRLEAFGTTTTEDGVTKPSSGDEFIRRLTKEFFELGKVDKNTAAILAGVSAGSEQKQLFDRIQKSFDKGVVAQEELNKFLRDTQNKISEGIVDLNTTFINQLTRLFTQSKLTRLEREKTVKVDKLNTLKGQSDAGDRIAVNLPSAAGKSVPEIQAQIAGLNALQAAEDGLKKTKESKRASTKAVANLDVSILTTAGGGGVWKDGKGPSAAREFARDAAHNTLAGIKGKVPKADFDRIEKKITSNEAINKLASDSVLAKKKSGSTDVSVRAAAKKNIDDLIGKDIQSAIDKEDVNVRAAKQGLKDKGVRGANIATGLKNLPELNKDMKLAKDATNNLTTEITKLTGEVGTLTDSIAGLKPPPVEIGTMLSAGIAKALKKYIPDADNIARGVLRRHRLAQKASQGQVNAIPVQTNNSGGPIFGVGNTDTVPAMLTPGEFVIRKSAVQSIGLDELHAMNAQGFVKGGIVPQSLFAGAGVPGFSRIEQDERRRKNRPGRKVGSDDPFIPWDTGLRRKLEIRREIAARNKKAHEAGIGKSYLSQKNQDRVDALRFGSSSPMFAGRVTRGVGASRMAQKARQDAAKERLREAHAARGTTIGGKSKFNATQGPMRGKISPAQRRANAIARLQKHNAGVSEFVEPRESSAATMEKMIARRNKQRARNQKRSIQLRFKGQIGIGGMQLDSGFGSRDAGLGTGDTNADIYGSSPSSAGPPMEELVARRQKIRGDRKHGRFKRNAEGFARRQAIVNRSRRGRSRRRGFQGGGLVGGSGGGGGGGGSSVNIQGIEKLQEVMNAFSNSAGPLAEALNNFPREIQHTISGQVDVIFNGAEVLASVEPKMQELITARVKDGLNNLIATKFPDTGPID